MTEWLLEDIFWVKLKKNAPNIYKRKKERTTEKKTDHVNRAQMKLYTLYKDRYRISHQWFVNLFGARSRHVSATYFVFRVILQTFSTASETCPICATIVKQLQQLTDR
jgi:hypothetical protein